MRTLIDWGRGYESTPRPAMPRDSGGVWSAACTTVPTWAAAALAFAVGLIALALASPATAQDDLAALRQQVATLTARLETLERKLDAPMKVRAPFVVVSDAGGQEREVLKIEASDAEVKLSLGFDEEEPGFEITDSRNEAHVTLSKEAYEVELEASPFSEAALSLSGSATTGAKIAVDAEGAEILAVSDVADEDSDGVRLTMNEEGPQVALQVGGTDAAILGAPEGEEMGLRIYDAGGEAVASVSMDEEGRGSFDVIQGGSTAASLTAGDGGSLEINTSTGEMVVWAGALGSDGSVNVFSGSDAVARMFGEEGNGTLEASKNGVSLASLSGGVGDGVLQIKDSSGTLGVSAAAIGGEGVVDVHRAGETAATLGPGTANNTALRIFGAGDTVVAAIGSDAEGAGALRIGNASGEVVASMTAGADGGGVHALRGGIPVASLRAEERTGVVAVYNAGVPVAYLNRSSGGDGGNITVSMNDGSGVFSAGAAQDGAGEACVFRRTGAGTERMACVGLGLPSMGLGK